MIDDFWFTDCECDECRKARGDQSWAEYRCDLMVEGQPRADPRAGPRGQSQGQDHHQVPAVVRPVPQSRLRGRARRPPTSTGSGSAPRPATTRTSSWGGKVQYEAYLHHALARRDRRAQVRRRLVRPLRHARGHLRRAGPPDGPGRREGDAAVLLRLAPAATPARPTSRSSARRSPACSSSPRWCGASRSRASPLPSRRTATPATSSTSTTSSACSACRWCRRPRSAPTSKRPSCRSTH